VRYALEIDIALRRGEPWMAIELLHRTRNLLMELFAQAQGGARPVQTFDAQADSALQTRFGATLPTFVAPSIWRAHQAMLDLLEQDIPTLSNGQAQLAAGRRDVLRAIREQDANSASSH
jgi:hypothetical protein